MFKTNAKVKYFVWKILFLKELIDIFCPICILQIDPAEGAKLAGHFKDGASKAMASGIVVNQVKYMFIKKDEFGSSDNDYRVLIGKKGPGGVSIYKSDKGE